MRKYILILLSFLCFEIGTSYVSSSVYAGEPQPLKRHQYLKHNARSGESISSILKIYNIPLAIVLVDNPKMRDLNYSLQKGNRIYIRKESIGCATKHEIDEEIKLYNKARGIMPYQDTSSVVKKKSEIIPLTKEDLRSAEMSKHIVLPKETLYSISKQYGVSIDDIKIINPEVAQFGLKIGMEITIPIVSKSNNSGFLPTIPIISKSLFLKSNTDTHVNVVVMLPISGVNENMSEGMESLYKGMLVAMDSLKSDGLTIHVELFDTKKNTYTVDSIINTGAFNNADIIIGPVFNNTFNVASRYAESLGIPIISPLTDVSSNLPNVVQMSPYLPDRYDKLPAMFNKKKVVFFKSSSDDIQFKAQVSNAVSKVKADVGDILIYKKDLKPEDILPFADDKQKTIFVISATNLVEAEMMISKLTAFVNSYPYKKIAVYSAGNLAKIDEIKKAEFFKVETSYITSYHCDRINEKSYNFEKKYINFYNEIPNMMSYRGYDMTMIFLPSLRNYGGQMLKSIEGIIFTPLQVSYSFFLPTENGKLVNEEWSLVKYNLNKSIEIQ
ncbi:MAG: LysM peptidoglycan-binding domain-containing protein [Bacteroidetes bacterium]|nr:LysM peptidoglycan-binding domain-containing protein [Bacteroidota bacterium]